MKMKRTERGFTLLTVLLVLVLVLTVLVTTLRESGEALTSAAFHRDRALMSAALDVAVAAGIDELSVLDGTRLIGLGDVDDPAAPFDLFRDWNALNFIPQMSYPPNSTTIGETRNSMLIRVGAVRGQRVRPPPGEDVRTAYGAIVHLQVSVSANRPGAPALEQRYEVGVRLPEPGSYR